MFKNEFEKKNNFLKYEAKIGTSRGILFQAIGINTKHFVPKSHSLNCDID